MPSTAASAREIVEVSPHVRRSDAGTGTPLHHKIRNQIDSKPRDRYPGYEGVRSTLPGTGSEANARRFVTQDRFSRHTGNGSVHQRRRVT